MPASKCPFCGAAESGPIIHHKATYWNCGSRGHDGYEVLQSETCKLIVAEATIERLTTELARRDEALDDEIVRTESAVRSDIFSLGLSTTLLAYKATRGRNQAIHDELNPKEPK